MPVIPFYFAHHFLILFLSSSPRNPLIVYGYIGSVALLLVWYEKFVEPKKIVLAPVSILSAQKPFKLRRDAVWFFFLFFLTAFVIGYATLSLIGETGFMREQGLFWGSIVSIQHGLWPNVHFYFPYGFLPIVCAWGLTFLFGNSVIATLILKIALDSLALFFVWLTLRMAKVNTWNRYFFIVWSIILFQSLFFSPASIHGTLLRPLSALLPLLFAALALEYRSSIFFILSQVSPIFVFLISPETGIVAEALALILWGILWYAEKTKGIVTNKKWIIFAWYALLGVCFFYSPLTPFFKNSFQYARSVVGGLVEYNLPIFWPLLKKILMTHSLDGAGKLVFSGLFYLYLFPLSIFSFWAIKWLLSFIKTKHLTVFELVLFSFIMLALGYFFKSLGGATGYAYESLTLVFVLPAAYLLFIENRNDPFHLMVVGIVGLYGLVGVLVWAFFFYRFDVHSTTRTERWRDSHSQVSFFFPPETVALINAFQESVSELPTSAKILIVSEDAPGLYYIANRPNYSRFANPLFVFSTSTRQELLSDIQQQNYDAIFFFKTTEPAIVVAENFLYPKLTHYDLREETPYFKMYLFKK